MFPVFVRGEAYLAARQSSKAAAEFQKILAHRGLVLNNPSVRLPILASVALMCCGATPSRPRRPNEDFLTLWKDADPDIPVLQQAKAEYTKCSNEEDSAMRY